MATDTGKNLFSPGKTPRQNAQFLVFLAAFIKGVDEYQDFLRCTVASAGNDRRLGANEAPPVIISIFLGDELNAVVESIINGTNYTDPEKSLMRIGVDVLPSIPKDTTDRNRTSPLAFTGNKFEFRMLGSSQSIAGPNIVLNTIMAEELSKFADELEKADDFDTTLQKLICDALTDHQRILFNGNGYSEEWYEESARRGLSNLRTATEAIPQYLSDKNVNLVTRHGIFTEPEFRARYEIHLETYRKLVNIEAKTTYDMAIRQILPAVSRYSADLADRIQKKKSIGCSAAAEEALAKKLSVGLDELFGLCENLQEHLAAVPSCNIDAANYFSHVIVADMDKQRKQLRIADQRHLDGLGQAVGHLPWGQGVQQVGVDEHLFGLMEGAHHVFDSAEIDGGLAADGGVDLGQQGGGDVVKIHPTHIGGGGKSGHVPHNAAAHGHHAVVARESVIQHGLQ